MDPNLPKKWSQRSINELKNVLSYMNIDWHGRSLEWLSKAIDEWRAPDENMISDTIRRKKK